MDDLAYIFRVPFPVLMTENDIKVADILQRLITNFARYGEPTPFDHDTIPKWNKVQTTPKSCVYMDISETPTEQHGMEPVRMAFWNKIYFEDLIEEYGVVDDDFDAYELEVTEDEGSHEDSFEEDVDEEEEEKVRCRCGKKLKKIRNRIRSRVQRKLGKRGNRWGGKRGRHNRHRRG